MKKSLGILVIGLILGVGTINAQVSNKRFMIKSGHVEYKLEGMTKGTCSIWFDDYGRLYREEKKATTTTNVLGMKSVEDDHTLKIVDGVNSYNIDLINQTGTKHRFKLPAEFQNFVDGMDEQQKKKLALETLQAFGGKMMGIETFMGRECEIIEVMGTTQSTYKGIPLKTKSEIMGTSTEIADLFEENISVSASLFEVPDGIEMMDLNQETDAMDLDLSDDDADEEIVPLTYSFQKFEMAIDKVQYQGYKKSMCMPMGGQYMAAFMKGLQESFMISALSNQGFQSEMLNTEANEYERFVKNGREMYFGKMRDEESGEDDGNVLFIEYPQHEMVISIMSPSAMSKESLLVIANQLQF
ncbi:DUF4367 domain-containing protein [Ancylomarina salipaludis]|uniref:DUF4367 domain-containing protein n=1 Tax=Ancylomarina salipaludis TaxID=2501299 RepID=A0A4Q1JNS0_9BACT|nr:DUF4367 domain-containing protein [Ancylomarina salipaludis]RXQ95806.1 DUF4367 domain-containing protein [Ancylomarina salipaludis]